MLLTDVLLLKKGIMMTTIPLPIFSYDFRETHQSWLCETFATSVEICTTETIYKSRDHEKRSFTGDGRILRRTKYFQRWRNVVTKIVSAKIKPCSKMLQIFIQRKNFYWRVKSLKNVTFTRSLSTKFSHVALALKLNSWFCFGRFWDVNQFLYLNKLLFIEVSRLLKGLKIKKKLIWKIYEVYTGYFKKNREHNIWWSLAKEKQTLSKLFVALLGTVFFVADGAFAVLKKIERCSHFRSRPKTVTGKNLNKKTLKNTN